MSADTEVLEVVLIPHPYDAIGRCMELLDEIAPGWRKEIDCLYPIGQVRVAYAKAMRVKGRKPWIEGRALYYGLDAPDYEFGPLQSAWREVLAGGAA